jgi:hypothetical protein
MLCQSIANIVSVTYKGEFYLNFRPNCLKKSQIIRGKNRKITANAEFGIFLSITNSQIKFRELQEVHS